LTGCTVSSVRCAKNVSSVYPSVNQGGTNHNWYMKRLVNPAWTDLLMISDTKPKTRSV